MPSIDDPAVFLARRTEREGKVKEGAGRVNGGDGGGRESFRDGHCIDDEEEGEREVVEDAGFATPVRKTSIGMVFSDAEGEEEEEKEEVEDNDDSSSVRHGYFEDDERSGYEGRISDRNAGENGYGHDHYNGNFDRHVNSTFSAPSTVTTPLPDPDEPLPSIEPYSSPAHSLSSPKSRSVSKSADNTPSSHNQPNHGQQRNGSGGVGSGIDSHPLRYDDNTTTLQYHLRNQHLQGSNRPRQRRRTSLSTNLSATSTVSSLPSSILGPGQGPFVHPEDPTSAFAPMSRRPRPIVNRSEMLRMMPRSVPAKTSTGSGGGSYGLVDGTDGMLTNGRIRDSREISMIGGDDDDEIDSPSRGKGRIGRSRMMSKGEGMYGDGRSSLSLTSSNDKDGDWEREMDRQIQLQSALVLPPSPSPSLSPLSSSSQTRSHGAGNNQELQSQYDGRTRAHAQSRTQTRFESPMTATKFFTPQPQLPPPLVLLHATILPPVLPLPYSSPALATLAPPFIHRNARLLAEKVDAQVLARGVLVAHPHEDYELLEERILESLELVIPRISVCGHFLGGDSGGADMVDKEDGEEEEDEEDEEEEDIGNGRIIDEYIRDHDGHISEQKHYQGQITSPVVSSSTSGAAAARPHCTTCAHPLRIPFSPADLNPEGHDQMIDHVNHSDPVSNDDINNASTLRWDVRVYAANGLMRAGAWATAWREMERVDVQIGIWIPEGLKSRLEEWDQEHGYVDGVGAGDFNGVEDGNLSENNCLHDLDNAIELKNREGPETKTEADYPRYRDSYFDLDANIGRDDGRARNFGRKIRGEGDKPNDATKGYHNSLPRTPTTSNMPSSPVVDMSDRRQQIPPSLHMHESVASESLPAERSRKLPELSQRQEVQFKHNDTVPIHDGVNAIANDKAGDQRSTPVNMPSSPPPIPPGLGTRTTRAATKDATAPSSSLPNVSDTKVKDDDRIILSPSSSPSQQQHKPQQFRSPAHDRTKPISISSDNAIHQSKPNIDQDTPSLSSSSSSQPATEFPSHFDSPFSSTSLPHLHTSKQPTSSASSAPSPHSSSSSRSTHKPKSTSSTSPRTSNRYTSFITRHLHQPQNIIIVLLSLLVAFLALRGGPEAAVAPSASASSAQSAGADVDVSASASAGGGGGSIGPIVATEPSAAAVVGSAADKGNEREVEEHEEEVEPPKAVEHEHEHEQEYGTVNIEAKAIEADTTKKTLREDNTAAEDTASPIAHLEKEDDEKREKDEDVDILVSEGVDGGEDLVEALLDS